MLRRTLTVERFASKGEKTGWYYLLVDATAVEQLQPGEKRSFRVRGTLDQQPVRQLALIPMGDGTFIMPLNASLRKQLGVRVGYQVAVSLEYDPSIPELNEDLALCLADDPAAAEFFYGLPRSHQMYFSRWIDSAKTEATRTRRITMTVSAASRKMGYAEMIRYQKGKKD